MRVMYRYNNWLRQHPVGSFFSMTIGFIVFGWLSFDLIRLLTANADYLSSYGLMALQDGGLRQLLELCVKATAAMVFWVMFKIGEHNLINAISQQPSEQSSEPGG